MSKPIQIGILAIQGGYQAHAQSLIQLGVSSCFITKVEQLATIDGLIIPGGESSTLLKFILENGLFNELQTFNKPIFGTCAGAILLANKVINPTQSALGLIDITIERNAYGRQLASHISQGEFIQQGTIEMIFIRAPKIKVFGSEVKVLATCDDEIVCVQQGNNIAATFHPELSAKSTLHQYFIEQVTSKQIATV